MRAKKDFDIICNYSKREEDKLHNTGHFYAQNEDLCYYLMDKCFKKTSSGVWESFLRFDLNEYFSKIANESGEIRVCGVGGGPASDAIGSVCYLADFIVDNSLAVTPKFTVDVLDYSDQMWEKTSKEIVSSASRECLSQIFKEKKITFDSGNLLDLNYGHVDFTAVDTLKIPETKAVLTSARVITICWALNEAEMVEEFWLEFFSLTENALIIFIDGKQDKLIHLRGLLDRSHY